MASVYELRFLMSNAIFARLFPFVGGPREKKDSWRSEGSLGLREQKGPLTLRVYEFVIQFAKEY
jgi:hypothetical protein